MRVYSRWLLLLVLITTPVATQDWEQANSQVRRLDPATFTELPAAIVVYLRERACTVPQVFAPGRPGGVLRGHFTSASQLDWAVLCSVRRVSTIFVFRGGSPSRVAEIARHEDATFLQVVAQPNVVGYSRAISVASPAHIRSYGGHKMVSPLDHDGIEDAFVGKGSTILYWYRGRWRDLPGAD